MPIYQYKCSDCPEILEIQQSFDEDSLTSADGCQVNDDGKHSLKKVFSSVGISFKGSGFYANDSRGANSTSTPPSTSSEAKSSTTESTSTTTSSDSKSSSSSTD